MSISYHFHYELLKLELAQDMRVVFKCSCVFNALSVHRYIYLLGFFSFLNSLFLRTVIISVLFWLSPTQIYTIFSLSSFLLLGGFVIIQD